MCQMCKHWECAVCSGAPGTSRRRCRIHSQLCLYELGWIRQWTGWANVIIGRLDKVCHHDPHLVECFFSGEKRVLLPLLTYLIMAAVPPRLWCIQLPTLCDWFCHLHVEGWNQPEGFHSADKAHLTCSTCSSSHCRTGSGTSPRWAMIWWAISRGGLALSSHKKIAIRDIAHPVILFDGLNLVWKSLYAWQISVILPNKGQQGFFSQFLWPIFSNVSIYSSVAFDKCSHHSSLVEESCENDEKRAKKAAPEKSQVSVHSQNESTEDSLGSPVQSLSPVLDEDDPFFPIGTRRRRFGPPGDRSQISCISWF